MTSMLTVKTQAMLLLREAIDRGATDKAMRILLTGRAVDDGDVSIDWPVAVMKLEALMSNVSASERQELASAVGGGGIDVEWEDWDGKEFAVG